MTDSPDSEHNAPHRFDKFLHPSGKTVHVANNPEHAETLRRQLTNEHGEKGFDLYIKGSEEHVRALHEARAHHEQRRNDLRTSHAQAWEDFEKVHHELDVLSSEINNLSNQGVKLDANFDRFGYSAHIKTINDDSASTSGLSRTLSARSEGSADRPEGEAIKLWRRPVVRQYFHKGLIWRASEEAQVSAMELFVDLIFVGLLAIMGDTAVEEPTGEAFLQFCITLILSYHLWNCATTINAWFVSNDLYQRFCIVFYTACLVGYTTNVQNALGVTYTELIAFYLTGRLFTAAYYLSLVIWIPMLRVFLTLAILLGLVPSALWIASIHVEYPNRLGLIWVAIVLDLYGNALIIPFYRWSAEQKSPRFKRLQEYLQFYPAVNIEHRTERMNAFVTLVIGYSVVGLLYQSHAPDGINAFFGKAILGLIIAVVFNLIYFEVDSTNLYVHAIRRHAYAFAVWHNVHLPFVLSFTLGSAALSKLVVAHDCPNTDIEALAEISIPKSVEEIDAGLRWFFCGGIGVALACTVAIAASHDHKKLPGLRFSKRYRLAIRSLCAVIIIVLPTAEDRLNSLQLIAVVTGILLFSLLIELWGCSSHDQGSFWADTRNCNYATECKLSKKDLEALRKGEVSGVEELAKRRKEKKWEKDRAELV